MFGKNTKGRTGLTFVGAGDSVQGTIRTKGSLHVDGEIEGAVQSDAEVSIGPEGVVRGEVAGRNVTIGGRVEGKVMATGHLRMLSTGIVEGDALFATLEVERGGRIQGYMGAIQSSTEPVEVGRADRKGSIHPVVGKA